MAAIIFLIVLLLIISVGYPVALVIWFKLHNDKRSIIEIIIKEC